MRAERRRRELCVTVFERLSTEAKPAEGRPWPSDDDDDDVDDDDDNDDDDDRQSKVEPNCYGGKSHDFLLYTDR